MKPWASFAHYITMVPLTGSMQSFPLRCLSPHSLINQKSNIYEAMNTVTAHVR